MMGVIVKSAGPTGYGTTVRNAETGEELKGVARLSISIARGAFTTVEADIFAATIDVSGTATFYVTDPASGQSKPVQRIQFADGSEWSV